MLFLCALVYLAIEYIRPGEVLPVFAGVPLADIAAMVAGLAAVFSFIFGTTSLPRGPADKYVALFWVTIVVSTAATGWAGGAVAAAVAFGPVAFCYFLLRVAIRSESQVRTALKLLVVLSVFQAVAGIVQYHTGIGLGGVETIQEGRIRGTGIFNDPNDLGMILVMSLPFILTSIVTREGALFGRWTALLLCAPIMQAIVYTNSRGAVLGVGAVVAGILFQRTTKPKAVALTCIVLAFLAVAAPSRAQEIDASEESAQGRIEAWASGLAMLKAHPVLGVGFERFTEYHDRVAHNSFIHAFAELGVVGGFCFVGLFHASLRRRERNDSAAQAVALSRQLALSVIGAAVCSFFLSRQYVVVLYVLFAISASHAEGTDADTGLIKELTAVLLWTVGVVAAIYVMVLTLGAW